MDECKENVSSSEFVRWCAHFEHEDTKRTKFDHYAVSLIYQVYALRQVVQNLFRDDKTPAPPVLSPEDFYVVYKEGPEEATPSAHSSPADGMTEEQMKEAMASMKAGWLASFGGAIPQEVLDALPKEPT